MKKIKRLLYNLIHNSYLWVFISMIIIVLNGYVFYRANYQEEYSISYSSQRLTITLQDKNYIEVFRLHDYWVTESNTLIQLVEEEDRFAADYLENSLNGSITEVSEVAIGENAQIESFLIRNEEGGLRLVRKIEAQDNSDLQQVDKLYMQFTLGGENYDFNDDERLLTAGTCALVIESQESVEFRYQGSDSVLTVYKEVNPEMIETGSYEFNFDFKINCE